MNNQVEKINARLALLAIVFITAACCHKDITTSTNSSVQKIDSTSTVYKYESPRDSTNTDSLINYVSEYFNPVYDSAGHVATTYLAKRVAYIKHAQQVHLINTPKIEALSTNVQKQADNNTSTKAVITKTSKIAYYTKLSICVILIIILIYVYIIRPRR